MARTLLTHKNCGGEIVAELRGFRLIAPAFGLGYGKISINGYQFMTEDLKTPTGESKGSLHFLCMKCKKEIPDEKITTDIMAICSVCRNPFPVGELFVTDYSPLNCKNCLDEMKGEDAEQIKKLFDMPMRIRKSELAKILALPVSI